jgi:hypothetical protein
MDGIFSISNWDLAGWYEMKGLTHAGSFYQPASLIQGRLDLSPHEPMQSCPQRHLGR